jgi:hypothetical protein
VLRGIRDLLTEETKVQQVQVQQIKDRKVIKGQLLLMVRKDLRVIKVLQVVEVTLVVLVIKELKVLRVI